MRNIKIAKAIKIRKLENPIIKNWFGKIVTVDEDGRELPVMCGCGGSEYLCKPCAYMLIHRGIAHNEYEVIDENKISDFNPPNPLIKLNNKKKKKLPPYINIIK